MHSVSLGSDLPSHHRSRLYTYLLRTSRVDHLEIVLRLVPVLPRQVHEKLARVLVVASIDEANLVLPGPGRRFPFFAGHTRRRRLGCWVTAALPTLAVGRSPARAAGRAAALLGRFLRSRCFCLVSDLFAPTDAL